jgi:hypothetical protein
MLIETKVGLQFTRILAEELYSFYLRCCVEYFGRSRRRWEDNIKTDLPEVG